MPKGKDPLTDMQIKLITDWIAQGAVDDTPASARAPLVDADHPPIYELLPVITSVAFSPEGELLAVAGYHEVLLHKGDGSGLVAPTRRPFRARSIGGVLAGRQDCSQSPAAIRAGSARSSSGTSTRSRCACRSRSRSTRFTASAGRRTASWSPAAARTTRSAPSTRSPANRSSSRARTRTGCSAPFSRRTASISFPSAAIDR